jgi:hypothetical protein
VSNMTNFNQNNIGENFQNQQSTGFGAFSGPQAVFQPGFAGTDTQEVRQQNAQSSSQNQFGGNGFQQGGQQQGVQSMGMGMGQFSGPQAVFQPGFARTDAQEVRQQNAQSSSQNQFGGNGFQQGGQQGYQPMGMGMGQFSGPQAIYQQGFAETDAQQVRQQNAQSAQNPFGGNGYQQGGQQGYQPLSMGMGQYNGPQAIYQQGFAGTDAQQVRQQNAQSAQNPYGGNGYQQGGQQGYQPMGMGMGQFSGPQESQNNYNGFTQS